MMKRTVAVLLILVLLLSLAACGGQSIQTETQSKDADVSANNANNTESSSEAVSIDSSFDIDLEGMTSFDELEIRIEEQLAGAIGDLSSRWKALSAEIDTYEAYCNNTKKVADFYQTIITETEQMCIMLCEYSAAYARMILDSDMSADDKYDAVGGINDCLYDDACDEINDEIYGGILDDMKDFFYEGILDDAKEDANYSDWYNVSSNEYKQWYDTSSDVYALYYDTASDIYSFYYDMSGELYSRDSDRAEEVYEKFLEKIEKLKGLDTGDTVADVTFDTALRSADNIENLETLVDAHVSECVQALYAEWETLSKDIDTFEKYTANAEKVEEFHARVENTASQILVMICEYGISYSELILNSDSSLKDKYKDFEDFKDCIYEDACEIVKDEIYEELLNEIKDYYYEGIIDDAKDSVEYSDWSEARSDAYSWWSGARSEVYKNWSNIRGDLYSYYSDIRSELFGNDGDGANDELQDFRDKVVKMN